MTTKTTSSRTKAPKSEVTPPAPPAASDDARVWLRENHYDDIVERIERVMATWKAEGKATRRNWWEILAGNEDGTPRIAGGIEFPILKAARIRQGLPDVPHAIQRNPDEVPPPVRVSGRWQRQRRQRSGRKRRR